MVYCQRVLNRLDKNQNVANHRTGFFNLTKRKTFMLDTLDCPELVCIIIHSKDDNLRSEAIDYLVIQSNFDSDFICYMIYVLKPDLEKDDDYEEILLPQSPQILTKLNQKILKTPNVSAGQLLSCAYLSVSLDIRFKLAKAVMEHKAATPEQLYDLAILMRSCDPVLRDKIEKAVITHPEINSEILCLAGKNFYYTNRILALNKLSHRSDLYISYLEEILNDRYASDEMKVLTCELIYKHPLASTKQLVNICSRYPFEMMSILTGLGLRSRHHQLVLSHLSTTKLTNPKPYLNNLTFILEDLEIPELCCLVIANDSNVREICFEILLNKPDLTSQILCHILDSLTPRSFKKEETPALYTKIILTLVNYPGVTANQLFFAMERSQDETQVYIQNLLIKHPEVTTKMLYDISSVYDYDWEMMSEARKAFLKHANLDEYMIRKACRYWYRFESDQDLARVLYAYHPNAILSELTYQLYFSGSEDTTFQILKKCLEHKLTSVPELAQIARFKQFTELSNQALARLATTECQYVLSRLPKFKDK
jgi:hypothetical protein